jgi:hypothetical protein
MSEFFNGFYIGLIISALIVFEVQVQKFLIRHFKNKTKKYKFSCSECGRILGAGNKCIKHQKVVK